MIQIKILSNAGVVYEGDVLHATFPGELGKFAVFQDHAPIISSLVKGNIVCFPANGEQTIIPVKSGFVEVNANQIAVCVE